MVVADAVVELVCLRVASPIKINPQERQKRAFDSSVCWQFGQFINVLRLLMARAKKHFKENVKGEMAQGEVKQELGCWLSRRTSEEEYK